MKFTLILLGATLALNSFASTLFDYVVYAKKGIHAECSDFLGKTGSNSEIELRDFLIQQNGATSCPLESSGAVGLTRGGIADQGGFSCVRTPNLYTDSTGVTGVENYAVEFDKLDDQMDQVSELLSGPVEMDRITLDASTFAFKKRIVLKRVTTQNLLVLVKGRQIKMTGMEVVLEGDLAPQNIVWHFPEAEVIELSFSGMNERNSGKNWGIPGTFLAPKARLTMNNALITGAVFVNEFRGPADREDCSGRVSGQVNPACLRSPMPTLGCKAPRRGGKG